MWTVLLFSIVQWLLRTVRVVTLVWSSCVANMIVLDHFVQNVTIHHVGDLSRTLFSWMILMDRADKMATKGGGGDWDRRNRRPSRSLAVVVVVVVMLYRIVSFAQAVDKVTS
jgi:hypothetical protein